MARWCATAGQQPVCPRWQPPLCVSDRPPPPPRARCHTRSAVPQAKHAQPGCPLESPREWTISLPGRLTSKKSIPRWLPLWRPTASCSIRPASPPSSPSRVLTGQPSSSTFWPKRLAACPAAVAEITDSAVILSLGGGVQSTALALMAVGGDLPPDFRRPRAAIFADTGWEPASVYAHLRWLVQTLGRPLPVHIVRAMRPDGTPVHIREDSEAIVRGETGRFANPPLFVKESGTRRIATRASRRTSRRTSTPAA